MLWIIFVILLLLWLLGMVSFYTFGPSNTVAAIGPNKPLLNTDLLPFYLSALALLR